jgi:hypothetical protein
LAVTPKTDEAFLREVDEELRRDRLVNFWHDYGRWTIGAIVAALLIFGGVLYWRYASNTAIEAEAVKMQDAVDALSTGNAAKAKGPIDALATSSSPGNRGTAKMLQADQLLQANNAKGAAAKFAEVAGDTTIGKPMRDLALIRQTAVEFDTLPPQTVVDRMKPLTVKDSAWVGSAGEMVALAYIRLNKTAEARAMFKTIAETDGVPDSIRQRAVQMVSALSDGATDQKGK